jgi:hypothetical protein
VLRVSNVLAMVAVAVLALIGLAAAIRLPAGREPDRSAGRGAPTPALGSATERPLATTAFGTSNRRRAPASLWQ